jgi:hypothetical protein
VSEFLLGIVVGITALGALALVAFLALRRVFERAAHRVADDIGRVVGELAARAADPRTARGGARPTTPPTRGVTHLGAYAAAKGMSEDAARREFAQSIERLARLMDSAIHVPGLGPVGIDAALGLFPVAGDVISAAIAVSLIGQSIKYGVPGDLLARMLANVLVDFLVGAVPVVGDLADVWFRANIRNVELLREFLGDEARDIIDVTAVSADSA